MSNTFSPFARPLYVMVKPAGPLCNLRCHYCYYLEKKNLYASSGEEKPMPTLMSDELLERFTREFIESQTMPQVLFQWHGGEPLLRPLSFYQKALALQKEYAGGRQIDNSLQTNGTLLTDEWCKFFHDNHFLIGISIDGPEEIHNAYRPNTTGAGSFADVMRGIGLLNKYKVEWNAMAVVNDLNVQDPEGFYGFFKSIGAKYIQFTPIVERIQKHHDGRHLASLRERESLEMMPGSVTPEAYGEFLCRLFDAWWPQDVGEWFIQLFDATLANWVGVTPGVCSMAKTCGHAAVMEHNGDVFACDHFVFPEYKLGNIHQQTLTEMLYSRRQNEFGAAKLKGLPRQCRKCRWTNICNGGCPKDRFCLTPSGEPGLNYLCPAYRRFFAHTAPAMQEMASRMM